MAVKGDLVLQRCAATFLKNTSNRQKSEPGMRERVNIQEVRTCRGANSQTIRRPERDPPMTSRRSIALQLAQLTGCRHHARRSHE